MGGVYNTAAGLRFPPGGGGILVCVLLQSIDNNILSLSYKSKDMEYKVCNLKGFEGLYHIYENGDIYSVRKRKMLKPQLNGYPCYAYKYVTLLGHNRDYYYKGPAHVLVILHFVGPRPTPKHEVNHIDMDKLNNHYTNLEWVTHRENILKARENKWWQSGRKPGFKLSKDAKLLMARRKYKRVLLFNDDHEIIKDSVEDACLYISTSRRQFNRYANTNKPLNGFKIKVLGTY